MSEMIERVARVIHTASEECFTIEACGLLARAAIEAMREPTIEMRMDGAVEMVKHSNVGATFTSMIDAALKEKE